ncbi:MAG: toprim domain-containing protein [Patescibacteria group bacterium]
MHYSKITPEKYLLEKGIKYKKINDELNYCCPNGCDSDSREGEVHGYMNAKTGNFQCKKCLASGGLKKFAESLGDTIGNIVKEKQLAQKSKKVLDPATVDICHKNLPLNIKRYLKNRGITNEIIDQNKLGWGSFYGRNWITIPVTDEKGKCFFKLRRDPDTDKTDKSEKYMNYPAGNGAVLFGLETIANSQEAFICEGEFDCMLLHSKGLSAISSTAGAGTFKDKWVEKFSHLKKIFIVFDRDKQGEDGSMMVAKKLSKIKDLAVHIITLPEDLGEKSDITGYFIRTKGSIEELLKLAQPFDGKEADQEKEEDKKDNKQMAILRDNILNEDSIYYFLDQFKEAYVRVKVGNHYEIMKCESDRFKRWLHKKYFEITNDSPSSENLKRFSELIISLATFGKEKRVLSVRIAQQDDAIWYDLGDDEWRAVRIDKNGSGWKIVDNPPILFKRCVQNEQVIPERNGNIKRLLNFVNIKDLKQQVLFLVNIIVDFFPHIIRPLSVYFGSQSSAKSTVSRMVKNIIDPAGTELLVLMGDQRELAQQLSHHYLLAFDNLSGLSGGISDILCKAVTGAGLTKRKLFSDEENIQFNFRRALILNGINLMVVRPDLLDRSLLFQFERIKDDEMKSDEQFLKEFDAEKGKLLGAIFDVMSKAMKIVPTIKLSKLPRMADFTRYGCAVAEVLGYGKELFLDAYEENRKIQNKKAVEENPIAAAISIWMEQLVFDSWEGTATELLRELQKTAENEGIDTKSRKWPKDASALSRRINEVKVNLFLEGIEIEKIDQREWQVRYIEECRKCRDAEENASNEAQNPDSNQNGTVVDNGTEDNNDVASELPF